MEIQIGDVLRYKKPACGKNMYEDGHLNFHFLTKSIDANNLQLEKGINPCAKIKTSLGQLVRSAILISSSPNKKGSVETPWEDFYDVDNGHIRYFGDNKEPGKDPATAPGNKALLEAFRLAHSHSVDERLLTPPILFFKRAIVNGVAKGYPQFYGLGIINSVELVTQWDNKLARTFTNYAFDFTVLCIAAEHEVFEWDWINSRRKKGFSLAITNNAAPKSWRQWLNEGSNSLNKLRRRVSKLSLEKTVNQKPIPGSESDKILNQIYDYYANKKHRFEALAEVIAERVIDRELGIYQKGWVTQGSGDGGADFIGKVTLGSGFSKVELIVLGQAKCESLNTPTGGNHIARTVARLKRGWLGVYVTTSYFSDSVQREVIEDKYPIILIHGRRLAEEVAKLVYESEAYSNVAEFLIAMDAVYPSRLKQRQAEEILNS
ncbi:restriction endonuclease [Shewanella xiamenensis]|uniref:restriction endonuclease n=1 Tax=Shewanella xiamenensis TaxID=332186 RepID=UPI000DAF7425|nr:restriction endonuclease [Shewanella xiamenensis]MCT8864124.1 restriction endonuclease [Shewanella xiamenensis]MCT8875942.1 restriction endonuclease [Shewanella xiamenensis]PZP36894.1 MAG: restriction endonuclease [Shewanella oneidensis]